MKQRAEVEISKKLQSECGRERKNRGRQDTKVGAKLFRETGELGEGGR